ncbi:family 43 glycosylhydrolase [Flammeovirga sp. OC4]|uniref:family 43 glycosylhydrolase n=1 Tax=Flammeovirga sp. OC4 TaxID=1382345 RepID=UPI00155DB858|nr:family 43 glycosylhydrolase [Flammeovirga sp. OC4]
MKNKLILLLLLVTLSVNYLYAQKPLLSHTYAADPSAHIWPNDTTTLWLYTSHDEPGTNSHKTMNSYHVFSTKDLVNWIDYGRVLSADDIPWASSMAWATDAVQWKGKYYLVHCMKERATGTTRTGLAVSDFPQGPFVDAGYIKGVDFGQDPALFVDDDGRAYLYWGAGSKCYGAELTHDLRAIKESTLVDLTDQLFEVFEGPWVHKYKGKYYLSYPGLPDNKWPEQMYYATADKPLGPYTYQKVYIPHFKMRSGTNHGSIIKWKGDWIAFHHSSHLSEGNSSCRNLLADWLTYDENDVINAITDPKGLGLAKKTNVTILLEAEHAPLQGGKLDGTYNAHIEPGYTGTGYITGFETKFNSVEVLAQVAKKMKADLTIRINAKNDFLADIFVGPIVINKEWGGMKIKKTDGWEEITFKNVQLEAGDNKIKFQAHKDANLKVDWFKVVPLND